MRKDSKLITKDSDWPLYRRFIVLVAAILLLLTLTYFAGLIILANLNIFFSEGGTTSVLNQKSIVPPPTVSSLPQATNSATLKIKGFAPEGTTAILFVNGEEAGSQITDKEGRFTFEDITLKEGENNIYTVGKSGGVESPESIVQTVLFDRQPPKLEINEPESGKIIKEEKDKPTLAVVAGKVDETATVTVNGRQAIVNSDGVFKHHLPLTEAGENTIKIETTDAAGNKTTVEKTVIYKKLEESES